jgi:hypothetical protein
MLMRGILAWLTGDSAPSAGSFLGDRQHRAAAKLADSSPEDVEPIQLSVLGALGAIVAAAALVASSRWLWLAVLVPMAMALNWYGLSVDLPLARRRHGFETAAEGMAHHVCETFSHLLLILAYGFSPFLTLRSATVILFCYLLFSAYVYIRAAARPAAQMAFIGFGVTEFRMLLAFWPLIAMAMGLPASRNDALPAIDVAVMSLGAVAVCGFFGKLVLEGRKLAAAARRGS